MIFLSNPQVWTLSGTWSDRALSASGLTNSELMMTLNTILLPVVFVVAVILEQIVKKGDNERNIYIVDYNRKSLWRNSWIINAFWFLTNLGLYLLSTVGKRKRV